MSALPDWARGPGAWALGRDPSLEEIDDAADMQDNPVKAFGRDKAVADVADIEVGCTARTLDAELCARWRWRNLGEGHLEDHLTVISMARPPQSACGSKRCLRDAPCEE